MWYRISAIIPNQINLNYSEIEIDPETNNPYGTIKAYSNDKYLGYIDFEIGINDNTVHVTNIFVFPENENQKIAQTLYKAVIDYSKNILKDTQIILKGDVEHPAALKARANAVQQAGGSSEPSKIEAPPGSEMPNNLQEALKYYDNPNNFKLLNVEHILFK